MAKKSKTVWDVRCSRFDCKFDAGMFDDEAAATLIACDHARKTKHHCEPRRREVDLCLTHGACLKIDHCPQCHVPFPLMIYAEPQETALFADLARAAVEHHKKSCATWSGGDWIDTVYACGCVKHDGHSTAMDTCKLHQPLRAKAHTQGRCYVCEAPLTKTAQSYQRKLDAEVAALFPFEQV